MHKFFQLLKATDYPDWMPAVAVKDFKQVIGNWRFSLCYGLGPFLLFCMSLSLLATTPAGSAFFAILLAFVIFLGTLIILPQLARKSIIDDIQNKNSRDIIVMTKVSAWEYIVSKWLLHWCTGILLLLSIAPFILIVAYMSHVNIVLLLLDAVLLSVASALLIICAIATYKGKIINIMVMLPLLIFMASYAHTIFFTALIEENSSPLTSLSHWLHVGIFLVNAIYLSLLLAHTASKNLKPNIQQFRRRLRNQFLVYLSLSILLAVTGCYFLGLGGYIAELMTQIFLGLFLSFYTIVCH